jgi:hypothetical protein
MHHFSRLPAVTVVCALIFAGDAAAAVTLGDGSFSVAFSITEAGADFAGVKTISASLGTEAFDSLDVGGRSIGFAATLFSDSKLRLSIEPLGASGFSYPLVGTFMLTDLDLVVDGVPADINGVTMNAAMTNIGQYADAGDLIPPTISHSDDSTTIAFGFGGSGLAGDQPRIWFNVATAAIPEPATFGLLLACGPAFVWLIRRRRKRAFAHRRATSCTTDASPVWHIPSRTTRSSSRACTNTSPAASRCKSSSDSSISAHGGPPVPRPS